MKHIISSLVIMAGGFALSASAATVNDVKDFSNTVVYTLNRAATSANGGGLLHAATDGTTVLKTATSAKLGENKDRANWSIHYSQTEKAYFLYNLSTGQFAGANKKHQAILTDAAETLVPIWNENLKYWMLDCGGYILGLGEEYNGKALFVDDIDKNAAREQYISFFTISSTDATVTDEQIAEIESKIIAARANKLDAYREFVTDAENIKTTTNTAKYLGLYDLAALKYALENESKYSLAEIEEIYQQTLLSRYPKEGHYYRLHNRQRPGSYVSNHIGVNSNGNIVSRKLTKPTFGTAANGYAEDLCLVRFWPVHGDLTKVNIEIPAIGKFLTFANNNAAPGLTASRSDASVYDLETTSLKQLYYRFAQPEKNNWLTISGGGDLVGYGVEETAMQFYIEPVNTIEIPIDANGYATVCLPCGIELPEGVKAYTVTDFSNAKAYVEELESPVHLNTPMIIKAPAGAETVELIVKNNTNWTATAMAGNLVVNNEAPGRYVPAYSADGISFTYTDAATALPGTAYIVSDNVGDVTTVMGSNPESGIEDITVDEAATRELYDLQGRRVAGSVRPGIYINAATKRAIRVN